MHTLMIWLGVQNGGKFLESLGTVSRVDREREREREGDTALLIGTGAGATATHTEFNLLQHNGQYMYRTVVTIYIPHSGHYMYHQWSIYVTHSGHYMYRQWSLYQGVLISP